MKTILLLVIVFASLHAAAQTVVSPDSAKYNIGSLTIVCGKVEGGFMTKSGVVFLNFGKPYPDQTFTAVLADLVSGDASFSIDSLKGKNVCVTGKIVEYKGKPEIKVNSKEQIRIQ